MKRNASPLPLALSIVSITLGATLAACNTGFEPELRVSGLEPAPSDATRYAVGSRFVVEIATYGGDRGRLSLRSSDPGVVSLGRVDGEGDAEVFVVGPGRATITLRHRDGTVFDSIDIDAVMADRVELYPELYMLGSRWAEHVPRVAAEQPQDVSFFTRAFAGDESLRTGGGALTSGLGSGEGRITLREVPAGEHSIKTTLGETSFSTTITAVPVNSITRLELRRTAEDPADGSPSMRALLTTAVDGDDAHVIGLPLDYWLDGEPGSADLAHGFFMWPSGGPTQRLEVSGAGFTASAEIDAPPDRLMACAAGHTRGSSAPALGLMIAALAALVRRRAG